MGAMPIPQIALDMADLGAAAETLGDATLTLAAEFLMLGAELELALDEDPWLIEADA
jgi:hypothetical protein